MNRTKTINVFYTGSTLNKTQVGTLALYQNRYAAFEYSREWLAHGFSLSPFSLPLEQRVFIPEWEPFGGLAGVFNDSLPDGWGRLLADRVLQKNHINPDGLSVLDRLAVVGGSGMGALSYEPAETLTEQVHPDTDLDTIAGECRSILQTDYSSDLDYLFAAGGSSGGARPKILTKINDEDWIIKFPSSGDSAEIGRMEYEYSLCAKKCGIEITETKLFPSKRCSGYFGTKRFDRNPYPVHMVTASGLLETSHLIPNLDYTTLMTLTLQLTKNYTEPEKLFRRMCFNVFAHNRDDHSKNFSWLYDDKKAAWRSAPAYDLTRSNSIGGEHATTIDGEGKNPGIKNLLAVAAKAGLKETVSKETAQRIQETVHTMLAEWEQ
ncbi:MAG: type II toxin-antitoxin system HipA family toxin [Treponema sp.]